MQCKNPHWYCWLNETGEKIMGRSTMYWTTEEMVKHRWLIKSKVVSGCGMCMACRINYTEDWTNRIMTEKNQWNSNIFLTLTYDDQHIPESNVRFTDDNGEVVVDLKGKEVIPHPLIKKDLQDFNKRLLRHWDYQHHWDGIRHYGVGEYGDETGRPHYHEILFNFPIYDGKEIGVTTKYRQGHKIQYMEYFSAELQKLWPHGVIRYGEVNETTARYVAGYALKKVKGKEADAYYEERGLTPEFMIASRKPGIGMMTFDEQRQKILSKGNMTIQDAYGGKIVPIPKGFKQAATRRDHYDEKRQKLIPSRYGEEEAEANKQLLDLQKPKHQAIAEAIERKMRWNPNSSVTEAEQYRINIDNAESQIRTKKGVF